MDNHRPLTRFLAIFILVAGLITYFSETVAPPRHLENICFVFKKHPKWYWASEHTRKKWGLPISTQMAFIYQESHFRPKAKPKREKLLGFIPWLRPTSASGYAQAVNATWQVYLRKTHQRSARRDDFATATDFIGWYIDYAHRQLAIPKNNVYKMYLAYHEGLGGFKRATYRKQPHLMAIARRVQARAGRYRRQLLRCEKQLPKKHWWSWI